VKKQNGTKKELFRDILPCYCLYIIYRIESRQYWPKKRKPHL